MPFHPSAYETQACHGFVTQKIAHAIDGAFAISSLASFENTHLHLVQPNGNPTIDAIPVFNHPFVVAGATPEEEQRVVVDVRAFGRWDPHQHTFDVRTRNEYGFQTLRGKLNVIWVQESPGLLQSITPLPLLLYSHWISQALARRFALDAKEQIQLQVLAAAFYLTLFVGEEDHWDMNRVAGVIVKTCKLEAKMVFSVLDEIAQGHLAPFANLDQFCAAAKTVTGSVRLNDLNRGLLYALLKSSWFGSNTAEVVGVALEHPPTWLAMVLSAAMDRSYHNSGLTRLLESWDRTDKGQTLVRAARKVLELA